MPTLVELKDDAAKSSYRRACPTRRARQKDYADFRDENPSGRISAAPPSPGVDLMRRIQEADTDDAIDMIYSEVDALLRQGEPFTSVDDLLAGIDVSALPTVHLLAFISITFAARVPLVARKDFVRRVRARLAETEPRRVEELLAGFE